MIKEGDDFVYNLITKEKYKHRPVSPHDLDKSIRKMRNHARAKGVKRINMPKISSGRDGLKWDDVLRLLEGAFRHENICIWVYHFNPDVKNKSDTVNLDVEEENNDENETTIRALKKELHNANKIIEVMQSNLRSDDVIKTAGLSDKAVSLLRSGQLTVSSLYSVLVNMEQELQSQKCVNDMLTMEMDEVKLNIPKLNGVEAEVKTLKVLLDEAMDEMKTNRATLEGGFKSVKDGLEAAVDKLARENHSIESGKKPLVHSEVKHFLIISIAIIEFCSFLSPKVPQKMRLS